MPYVGYDFTPMDTDESDLFAFDFVNDLQPGDSVSSVISFSCAVASSSPVLDPSPSSRLVGTPYLSGSQAVQRIGNTPLDGVIYLLTALVMTQDGNSISLWSHVTCVAPS